MEDINRLPLPEFYQLGTQDFPVYLSMGDDGMIIEGGTGAFFPLIVNQIKELGIAPERIKYLALTPHPSRPHRRRAALEKNCGRTLEK